MVWLLFILLSNLLAVFTIQESYKYDNCKLRNLTIMVHITRQWISLKFTNPFKNRIDHNLVFANIHYAKQKFIILANKEQQGYLPLQKRHTCITLENCYFSLLKTQVRERGRWQQHYVSLVFKVPLRPPLVVSFPRRARRPSVKLNSGIGTYSYLC